MTARPNPEIRNLHMAPSSRHIVNIVSQFLQFCAENILFLNLFPFINKNTSKLKISRS